MSERGTDVKELVDPELNAKGRIFGKGVRGGRPMLDTDDFDAVRAYAHKLWNGHRWHLTGQSEIELRALAKMAALGGDAIWLASELVALSDANAPQEEIKQALKKLADFVRPLIGRDA